jgi:hypothetical protein
MTWTARTTLLIIVALGTAVGLLDSRPAQASCAASPGTSPYHFAGTVTAVGNSGRTATVRTDDGRTVTVLGSDVTGPNAATSVDRAYLVGARYEFHPVNDSDPYRDNICTATHPIGPDFPDPAAPAAAATTTTPAGWLGPGIAALALLLAGAGLWLLRHRASRSH